MMMKMQLLIASGRDDGPSNAQASQFEAVDDHAKFKLAWLVRGKLGSKIAVDGLCTRARIPAGRDELDPLRRDWRLDAAAVSRDFKKCIKRPNLGS